MFNSPNNPSGTIYTENELRALGKVLEKHPNIKEYVYSVMYIALATVSFMTAVHSRKKTKAKIAQLVSVESISVNSPPTIDPPEVIASIESPPEDQH